MSSTMSLILSMNHSLLLDPNASALEEDAGKYIYKLRLNLEEEEEDS